MKKFTKFLLICAIIYNSLFAVFEIGLIILSFLGLLPSVDEQGPMMTFMFSFGIIGFIASLILELLSLIINAKTYMKLNEATSKKEMKSSAFTCLILGSFFAGITMLIMKDESFR